MNDLVLEAGGRFYLAKDSTLRPSDVRAYLGEETLAKYWRLKHEFDPEGLLTQRPRSARGPRGPMSPAPS